MGDGGSKSGWILHFANLAIVCPKLRFHQFFTIFNKNTLRSTSTIEIDGRGKRNQRNHPGTFMSLAMENPPRLFIFFRCALKSDKLEGCVSMENLGTSFEPWI